jgi:hypothetical protein
MPFTKTELLLAFCSRITLLDPVWHPFTIPEKILISRILKKHDCAG